MLYNREHNKLNTNNLQVRKRDGRVAPFDYHRITAAVHAAYASVYPSNSDTLSVQITTNVCNELSENHNDSIIDIEHIQDLVENELNKHDAAVARHYISYRDLRTRARNVNSVVNKTITDLIYVDSKYNDDKRENANIDGDSTIN